MSPYEDILPFRTSFVDVSFREPLTIRIGNSSELSGRTINKSKDLRKLQQNLFYKLPDCFVNDRIQRKNHGNLRKKCRLPLDFLNCHTCLAANLAGTSAGLRGGLRGRKRRIRRTGGGHIHRDGKRKKMGCFYAVIAIRLLFSNRKGNPLQWYPR